MSREDASGGAPKVKEADEDRPGLVIWHWKDPRLQSQQQVEESRDKRHSQLCVYRVDEKKFLRISDDEVDEFEPAPEGRFAFALHDAGYETVMVNCNPETVSTDYDTSDRLFFEPLSEEGVRNVCDALFAAAERGGGSLAGVIVSLGGQTPLKLPPP